MTNEIYQLLGLAKRAHFALVGIELFDKLKRNKVFLLILAEDSSDSFNKELQHNITSNCDIIRYKNKKELGLLLDRREVNAIGITDINMAKKIKEIIQKGDSNG